ncbi:UTRA domain-containing protein [Streptomyces alboviridis]|uniref:UTRA domain-containing protein n=1 Tax=Streptomyces alboviridis TaxID=67269 RepID=UPI0005177EA8|nr:UTRA domain-containing protein [Streptomyces alboviridis]
MVGEGGGEGGDGLAAATEDQAALLGVAAGAPVLLSRNVYVDAQGDTIEVGESVAPAGRWRVHRD